MDDRWLKHRVLSYAHQGGAWEAPSSTLFAIRRSLELGVTGVELDVHATVDGELVVCHDTTVDRTTDGAGEISELSSVELEKLDNSYWWAGGADVSPGLDADAYLFRGRAPTDREFGIATLCEVLDLMRGYPGVAINLDIKQTGPEVAPYEDLLAAELRRFGDTERVMVASFLDRATDRFSECAPEIATSAGTAATIAFYHSVRSGGRPPQTRHSALQVPARQGDAVVVDETFVAVAHDCGLAVHVWTINDPAEMERLIHLGVDGIISDRPSVLVGLLDRLQVAFAP